MDNTHLQPSDNRIGILFFFSNLFNCEHTYYPAWAEALCAFSQNDLKLVAISKGAT
jgi:hypothetical protein